MNASSDTAAGCPETAQLRQLLALHEAALESMTHGICVVDAEQRVVLFNSRYVEMYNLVPETVRVGMTYLELLRHSAECGNLFPTQIEDYYAKRLEMMARGEPFRLVRQMSNGRTYSLSFRPVAAGGWIVMVEDVSERQRGEYDLRVRFECYDQAVNHMSHGLCAVDADHRIVLFNDLFLKMYDLSPDFLKVGISMRDVIEHVAQRGYFRNATPEHVWQYRLQKMAPRKPFQQYMTLRNGNEYILHYHPMQDGGWVTLCEDVTERHRMERELRLQYERFDQAMSHMSHGLCMFGPDERLIVCNARYLDIYGLDPAVIKPGVTHRELLAHWIAQGNEPGMSAEAFYEKRKSAVAGKPVSVMQLHLKNGSVIEATSRPTPDGGWVSAHEDVTERLQYEKTLREQNILFDAALESMAHGICVFDKDWRVVVHNRRYLELYGLDPAVVKPGTPVIDLVRYSIEQGVHVDAEQSAEEFFEDFKRRVVINGSEPVVRRFADGRLIAVRHQPMENGGWVCTFEDITERERAADALKEQHRRFDIALNNMAHGLCMFDADMRLIVSNKRYAEMFDLPPDFVRPGMPVRDVIAKSHALGNYRHRDVSAYELYDTYVADAQSRRRRRAPPSRRRAHDQDHARADGGRRLGRDLRGHHRALPRRAEHRAHGAPRRADRSAQPRAVPRAAWPRGCRGWSSVGETLAVLLPRPRQFQGRQRHARPSDRRQAARRHRGTHPRRRRARTTPSRALAATSSRSCRPAATPQAAGALARRLTEIISEPIEIDGQEINSGVSIGIALAPNDGNAADHLMKCADLALYRAKAEGRGTFRFFEPDMDARIQARRALEVDLRRALAAGEFSLAYQPQINLASNEMIAMEALLRWNHAERGAVPPCRVHSARRGNGPDRAARRMGAARGLQGRGALARSDQGRGQPLAGAVPQPRAGRDGDAGARRRAACAAPARARDHRGGAAAGRRDDRRHAASAARARRAHRDGRFRHRLLVAQLSALVPVRQDQDRPLVHQGHRPQPRQRGDHQGDREPRSQPRHRDDGRRHRDRGAARAGAPRRLHRDAGLSGEPAAPRLRRLPT